IMSNALLSYLNKRLGEENSMDNTIGPPGPVITISREVGCNGVKLAHKIAKRLNKRNPEKDWKVLSKEVFYKSAKELDVEPEKVQRVFKQSDRYVFNEILDAFSSKKYRSEKKIVKTVTDVIKTFSKDGFCIIVGRAGHIIAHDIKNALHMRLVAPLEYRIKTIMENNHLNREEAIDFIEKVEKERLSFRKSIGKVEYEEDMFDMFLNRASFDDEKTIDLIEMAIEKKNILGDYNSRMHYY
ncbi:MAG: AAA family ATPase, partial [Tangfeifania sp.]